MSRHPEQLLNDRILAAMGGFDPVRVENAAIGRGTPDINYVDGWIESKVIPCWPRQGQVVKVPKYVPHQRAWHVRRATCGGQVWLALEVRRTGEHFIFHGLDAAQHLGIDWLQGGLYVSAALAMDSWDKAQFRQFIHDGNRKQGARYVQQPQ